MLGRGANPVVGGPVRTSRLASTVKDDQPTGSFAIGQLHLIAFQMCILNFAVYIASSIYVPGEANIMEEFGVDEVAATLGLSLFTFGYGTGPMLWSPLSEIPSLGRTHIFF
ncbi:hypothetical protein diail_1033 [Diaporthe ilicicola]|nr:hypothetical protein diail_1033 [Diaporthe ilicicola]